MELKMTDTNNAATDLNSVDDVTEVLNADIKREVTKFIEGGMNIGRVEGYLLFEHDFSTTEAKKLVAEVREELGYEAGASTNWADTVQFLRDKYGVLEKKALIDGMCEINGKKYSSNQHAYNYIAMALEWAKQEVAAVAASADSE
jgi:hypothetical protein